MNVLKQYSQKEIKQAIYEIENVIHINKYNKALLKFGVNN